ncbi:conserved hypothetical protein [Ricinus communis]|uniref:LysM domain-containing protein n=1 Tax=Ricinus communis TaxID=3988 RepID=B9SHZ5_RICCO|nr:conserved hypothetical protein [Ricinus communis]
MAKFNNKPSMLLKLAIVLSLFLMISTAQSRKISSFLFYIVNVVGFGNAKSTPECDSVYGAQDGDTCTSLAAQFDLTLEFFSSINPNLNCDAIFVGQWLCTDGTA